MKSNEPKKDKAIGIRLPLETFEKLKARADAERRSVSNYVLLLIERDIASTGLGEPANPITYLPIPPASSKVAEPASTDPVPGDPPMQPPHNCSACLSSLDLLN